MRVMRQLVLSGVSACLLLTAACQSEPPPLEVDALVELGEQLTLKVIAQTKPEVEVKVSFRHSGKRQEFSGIADSSGKAVLSFNLDSLVTGMKHVKPLYVQDERRKRRGRILKSAGVLTVRAWKSGGKVTSKIVGTKYPNRLERRNDSLVCLYPKCRVQTDSEGLEIRIGSAEGLILIFQGQEVTEGKTLKPKVTPFIDGLGLAKAIYRDPKSNKPLKDAPQVILKGVKVRFKNGSEASGDIPVNAYLLARLLAQEMAEVRKGPIAADKAPTGSGIVAVRQADTGKIYDSRVLGKVKQLSDINLIAIQERVTTEVGKCRGYRDSKTGKKAYVTRDREDLKITVYERHTGKEIAAKTIKGRRPSCPSIAFGRYGAAHSSGKLPFKAATRWLKALTAKQ